MLEAREVQCVDLQERFALFERGGERLTLMVADDLDPNVVARMLVVEGVAHRPGAVDRLAVDGHDDVTHVQTRFGRGAAFLDRLHDDTAILRRTQEGAQLRRDVEWRKAEVDAAKETAFAGKDLSVPDDDCSMACIGGGYPQRARGERKNSGGD